MQPLEIVRLKSEQLRKLFDIFDIEAKGAISLIEFRAVLAALQIDLSLADLALVFASSDNHHKVNFAQFKRVIEQHLPRAGTPESFMHIFRLFCGEAQESISLGSLRALCAKIGEPISEQELQLLFDAADLDGDGRISTHEFLSLVQNAYTPPADAPR